MCKSLFDLILKSYLDDTKAILERYYNHDKLKTLIEDPSGFIEELESYRVGDCLDSEVVFVVSQLQGLLKRFVGKSFLSDLYSDSDRSITAISGFCISNKAVADINAAIKCEVPTSNSFVNSIMSEASCLIHDWFTHTVGLSVPLSQIAQRLRPGPGASCKASGPDFYSKVADGPLTYSKPDLYRLYRNLISYYPLASETEEIRFANHGKQDSVTHSILGTVPKSFKTDRTIATEPSVNMMLQLATGSLLEDVLSFIGIRLDTQPDINRELARLGSLNHTPFCTIDLRSASDMVSIELVRRLIPEDWFHWLMLIRSPLVDLPDGSTIELNMMSTMGNGFTFPLQTIVFSAIVAATYKLNGYACYDRLTKSNRFAVFGDDIIVLKPVFQSVVSALESVGFLVNHDKTFSEGCFRESCGADWYQGLPVRPVYVTNLVTQQDRISFLNRIIRWSARSGIGLPRVCETVFNSINIHRRYPVPNFEADDSGIHVPEDMITLPSFERSVRIVQARHGNSFSSFTYDYNKFDPHKRVRPFWSFRFRSGRIAKCTRLQCKNWPGVLLSILQGSIRGRGIGVRVDTATYDLAVCRTPVWCVPLDYARFSGWLGTLEDWKSSVRRNLAFTFARI